MLLGRGAQRLRQLLRCQRLADIRAQLLEALGHLRLLQHFQGRLANLRLDVGWHVWRGPADADSVVALDP